MWNPQFFGHFSADSLAGCHFHWHNRPMSTQGRSPAKGTHLDDVSKKIVEQLQVDGRRSYAEIGKAVGLSEAAVRQRVQKLLDTGVMQIVGVTDPLMLGF